MDDLETINMWAELSDVSNAASTTLNRTPETTTISRSDIAKIIKDAETGIGNEQKMLYSLKDTFYSNAENAVKSTKQEKATPEQWLKMIEKNGGLKAGEVTLPFVEKAGRTMHSVDVTDAMRNTKTAKSAEVEREGSFGRERVDRIYSEELRWC